MHAAPARELTVAAVLGLQPAGNTRVAALLQRAAARKLLRASVGWPGAKAINAGPKPSGSFTRFPVGGMTTCLPSGGTHPEEADAKLFTDESPDQRALVLVPTALVSAPPTDIDVFFFLHGHNIGWREGKKTDTARPGFAFKDKVRDEEDDNLAGELPSTVAAVLPQGTAKSKFGAIATDALIKEALGAVPGWSKVLPRRVVLSAHSGGGAQMTELLESKQKTLADRQTERKARLPGLSEVAMFDAINGDDQLLRTASFVNDSIDEDIAALESKSPADQLTYLESSMRFRAFYSLDGPPKDPDDPDKPHGFYQPFHERLKKLTIIPKLPKKVPAKHAAITQPAWDELREHYKIEPKGQSHAKKLAGGNLGSALGALKPGAAPTYPVAPKPPPKPTPGPSGTLKQGMVGPQVEELQEQLNQVAPTVAVAEVSRGGGELAVAREPLEAEHASRERGDDEHGQPRESGGEAPVLPLNPDGKFGPRTRAAVIAFQRSRGLTVDGIAGPQTRGALNAETLVTAAPQDGVAARTILRQQTQTANAAAQAEWDAHPHIHGHFAAGFTTYLDLRPLYQARGIPDPAAYLDARIVQVTFFGHRTPAHDAMTAPLAAAEAALTGQGITPTINSFWAFVPRRIAGGGLSNHALGKAVDINPGTNPHVKNKQEILVIDAVTGIDLGTSQTAADMRQASLDFMANFNQAWVDGKKAELTALQAQHPAPAQQIKDLKKLLAAVNARRAALNGYASHGFFDLEQELIDALTGAGFGWGGQYVSSKDFMHFELP